jgi:hypothetical protein
MMRVTDGLVLAATAEWRKNEDRFFRHVSLSHFLQRSHVVYIEVPSHTVPGDRVGSSSRLPHEWRKNDDWFFRHIYHLTIDGAPQREGGKGQDTRGSASSTYNCGCAGLTGLIRFISAWHLHR